MHRHWHPLLMACGLALMALVPPVKGAESFRMFTQPLLIPERGEVTSYVILTESNRFSFLPPPGWNARVSAPEKLAAFVPDDYGATISVQIVPGIPTTNQESPTNRFREQVVARYAEARIATEFPCHTSGRKGVVFDVERLSSQRPPVTTRLAFVPFEGGVVEFNLTTESRRFAPYHAAFGNLLTSFRIELVPRTK